MRLYFSFIAICFVYLNSPAQAAVTGLEVPDPGRGFARDRIVEGFECVGALGGAVSQCETYKQYAFLAQGCAMHIWDCSDPGRPRELSWVKFSSTINTISISYPAVYVATSYKAVHVLDISDMARPRFVDYLDGGGSYELCAHVIGDLLIEIEEGKYGQSYYLYEIADPLKPRLIRSGRRYVVQDYATNGRKFFTFGIDYMEHPILTVFDTADPKTTMTTIATFPYPERNDSYGFRLRDGELIFDARQTSETVPLLSREESKFLLIDGMYEGRESKPSPDDAARKKAVARLIETQNRMQFNRVKIADGKAYLAGEEGYFAVADVRNPAAPVLFSEYHHPAGVVSYAVEGDRLYLCDTSSTLTCFDASPAARPVAHSRVKLPEPATQMAAQGRLVLLVSDQGLRIYDYGKPESPKFTGEFKTQKKCFDLATAGDRAVIVTNGKISILDLADPAHPRLVREKQVFTHEDPGDEGCYRLKRLGNFLYVIQMTEGSNVDCTIGVVDLDKLDAAPRMVESPIETWDDDEAGMKAAGKKSPTQGWVLGLPVRYAQTSGGQSGINLFDLSDPGAPRLCGEYWRLSWEIVPVLFKDHIYLADGEHGLLILGRSAAWR